MNPTEEVIKDLFPHSDIETKGKDIHVKAPWCSALIKQDCAYLELIEVYDHPKDPAMLRGPLNHQWWQKGLEWGFSGEGWLDGLTNKVIEFESASPFFLICQTKMGSMALKWSSYATKPGDIKKYGLGNEYYEVWRGWENQFLLCSKEFHRKYLYNK